MIEVAHVTGRLSDQARRPQRTHEQIVQQFDDSKVEAPPVQEPPGKTDPDADSSNRYVGLRNTVPLLSAYVGLRILLDDYTELSHPSLHTNGTGGGAL
jgi:hypothetical protein